MHAFKYTVTLIPDVGTFTDYHSLILLFESEIKAFLTVFLIQDLCHSSVPGCRNNVCIYIFTLILVIEDAEHCFCSSYLCSW